MIARAVRGHRLRTAPFTALPATYLFHVVLTRFHITRFRVSSDPDSPGLHRSAGLFCATGKTPAKRRGRRPAARYLDRPASHSKTPMPELPEVETVRRGLEPVMAGAQIVRVEQRRAGLRFPFPDGFARRLEGRTILAVSRRAKYLIAATSGDDVLVMHLGMSGRFSVEMPASGKPLTFGDYVYDTGASAKHDHVVFTLSNGARIVYNDPRRFGFMLLETHLDWAAHPLCTNLGVEPLGNQFDGAYLAAKAAGRRADLKSFLLDQRIVAGLGNIYVSEALHRAGLSPRRTAATLAGRFGAPLPRAERLVVEIRAVLTAAIEAGGSSLRDYRHTDGTAGGFQNAFCVYGRDGAACLRPGCGGIIRRSVQGQRATYDCRSCQR